MALTKIDLETMDNRNFHYKAQWKPDVEEYYKKADAQLVAGEIYSLGDNPSTKEVLEMARSEDREIHKLIEWDDSIAAEKHRMYQVRKIMGNIQITEIKLEKKAPQKIKVPLRMFYHLKGEEGYHATPTIIENKDLNDKLLATAKAELAAFVTKYSILTELQPVFDAIRSLDNPPDNPAA